MQPEAFPSLLFRDPQCNVVFYIFQRDFPQFIFHCSLNPHQLIIQHMMNVSSNRAFLIRIFMESEQLLVRIAFHSVVNIKKCYFIQGAGDDNTAGSSGDFNESGCLQLLKKLTDNDWIRSNTPSHEITCHLHILKCIYACKHMNGHGKSA